MCKLERNDYFSAMRCKELIRQWLKEEKDVSIIVDKMLDSKYSLNCYIYVLAATVLEHKGSFGISFAESTVKWAEKYCKKIGFLGENIRIYPCPVKKIEELIILILRRKK